MPVLEYLGMGENEWELKRLRLSSQGFEVLDERGIISQQEDCYALAKASDSYRADYLEANSEYMEVALWSGLGDILSTQSENAVLGFVEYYGVYYLVTSVNQGYVLYSLGRALVFEGGMPFDEFCKKAWEFYCYTVNAPEVIYGGDGISTEPLPP